MGALVERWRIDANECERRASAVLIRWTSGKVRDRECRPTAGDSNRIVNTISGFLNKRRFARESWREKTSDQCGQGRQYLKLSRAQTVVRKKGVVVSTSGQRKDFLQFAPHQEWLPYRNLPLYATLLLREVALGSGSAIKPQKRPSSPTSWHPSTRIDWKLCLKWLYARLALALR